MLLREIKNVFHTELDAAYGANEVASFFYLLIEHYFNLERFVLSLEPNLTIDKDQETIIYKALADLKLERPIQHIIGTEHFMDLDFKVNEHVLIPRPETEELVRWILDDINNKQSEASILDMGTGSGCIPISLSKNLPNAKIKALDISTDALVIAKENADTHNTNVEFIQADILRLNDLPETERSASKNLNFALEFDVIVSNPPYVRELEKAEMHNNVIEREPSIALFVPDEDALLFYKAIVKYAAVTLKEKGALYLEINQYLGEEMISLLEKHQFTNIELRKDMFGNDRMLKGIRG